MLYEVITDTFADVDGILVPGGFGERGSEGKISAIRYSRENKLPFFGICLGMQMAVVEFSRYVCGIEDAHSSEFQEEAKNPIIHIMEEQKKVKGKGGTMRLGAYPCDLSEGTLARRIYGTEHLSERHRHRFEFNNAYRDKLQKCGLVLSGINPESDLVHRFSPKAKQILGINQADDVVVVFLVVITSYSIHYTKLYEPHFCSLSR